MRWSELRSKKRVGQLQIDDPFVINVGTTDLQIDLGAERLLAAEQGNERIAVEIKVFGNISLVQAFHTAVGQYMNYRVNLEEYHPERQLFLAVPKSIFETFFASELAIRSVKRLQIKLLIFDPESEVISWQP
jgi:hypothetical protein